MALLKQKSQKQVWLALFWSVLLLLLAGCSEERGIPGSTYSDWEHGRLTFTGLTDDKFKGIQSLILEYDQDDLGNFYGDRQEKPQSLAYFAYMTLENGDSVHFLDNFQQRDSGATYLRLGENDNEPRHLSDILVIPKYTMLLMPGSYKAKLRVECMLMDKPLTLTDGYAPHGKAVYWGEADVQFSKPQPIEYLIRMHYFDLDTARCDERNYDWPSGLPDLEFKIVKNISQGFYGPTQQWGTRRLTNEVVWDLSEDSIQFVISKGDEVILGVDDWDALSQGDFIADCWLDLEGLDGKGKQQIPDFGLVKNCSVSLSSRPYRGL